MAGPLFFHETHPRNVIRTRALRNNQECSARVHVQSRARWLVQAALVSFSFLCFFGTFSELDM